MQAGWFLTWANEGGAVQDLTPKPRFLNVAVDFLHTGQLFRRCLCCFDVRSNLRYTTTFMARRKKSEKELQPNIKVRLDRRTVITVRDSSKLAYWKEKFPGLEILEES